MGVGDEPKKIFFTLLKAKKFQGSMNMLILYNKDNIKNEANIL